MLLNHFVLFISGAEIGIIIFIAVLVMGTDKIPDFARSLGKGINEIKHATNEIKSEIKKSSSEIDGKSSDIKKEIDKVKDDIDNISSSIKRDL
ncbi:MAG: twin-arginine translocase TatA/TatE family subunit [Bacteroidota bacterium]|jgi:sec-independent protein translocase protein TatA|nr:twin-arginine translocase TatA/TatE family subunit [Flavobacteriaceae bacterium]MED5354943.1 twin-arginine translocase TatA/TatE family subunit [Bacteroidota bacterium]|tara:strand:- start:685 stop:963 length:279 start_codon:yes stop_codon:yes gene_type:complete